MAPMNWKRAADHRKVGPARPDLEPDYPRSPLPPPLREWSGSELNAYIDELADDSPPATLGRLCWLLRHELDYVGPPPESRSTALALMRRYARRRPG